MPHFFVEPFQKAPDTASPYGVQIAVTGARYTGGVMSDLALADVEAGMRFARARTSVLAGDAANAQTPGFVARDVALVANSDVSTGGFSTVLRDAGVRGAVGIVEFTMGAQARNAVMYRALADQERAMLRELRTVAEELKRG